MSYAELRSQFAHDLLYARYDRYVSGQKRQLMTHVPIYNAMLQAQQLKVPQPADRGMLLKKEISRGPLDGGAPALLHEGARDGLLKTHLPSDSPAPPIEPLKHTRGKLHKAAEQIAIKEDLKSFPDKVAAVEASDEYMEALTPICLAGIIAPLSADDEKEIAVNMAMKGVSERTKQYHARLLKERERIGIAIKKAGGWDAASPELQDQYTSINDALRPMADAKKFNTEIYDMIKELEAHGLEELTKWAAETSKAAAAAPPAVKINPDKEHEVAAEAAAAKPDDAADAAVDHPDSKHADPPEVAAAKDAAAKADLFAAIPDDKRVLIPSHILKPVYIDDKGAQHEYKDGDKLTMFKVADSDVDESVHLMQQYHDVPWQGKQNRLLAIMETTKADGIVFFVGEKVSELLDSLRAYYRKEVSKADLEAIKNFFGWGSKAKDKLLEKNMTSGRYYGSGDQMRKVGFMTLMTIPPFKKMWSPTKTGREATSEYFAHILPRGHVKSLPEIVADDMKTSIAAASPAPAPAPAAAASPAPKSKAVTAAGVVPNTADPAVQQLLRADNTGGDADDNKGNK